VQRDRELWEDAPPAVLVGALVVIVALAALMLWSARGGRVLRAARTAGYGTRARTAAPAYVGSTLFAGSPRVTSYVDGREAPHPFVSGVAHAEGREVAWLAVPSTAHDVSRALAPMEKRLRGLRVEPTAGWVVLHEDPAAGRLLQDLPAIEALARKVGERVRAA
jgi:hypothetical protein